jgi:hypothetical protein
LVTARKEPVMAEDLKAVARRILEEIIPNGDVAGLRAVMHAEVVNHEPPAGAPPGLDGIMPRWKPCLPTIILSIPLGLTVLATLIRSDQPRHRS